MNPFIRLPEVQLLIGRQDLILEKCRGKRVLHLGCVDTGMVEERFARGELMHQKLSRITQELWGVDINPEGIEFMRQKGINHLLVGDVCELYTLPGIQGKTFDIILASEVLEHLANPGLFLESVKSVMQPDTSQLILSVPNAFRIENLLWMLRGVEYIHPDHNYWFSYYTVTNLLQKCGFELQEVYAYTFQSSKILPSGFSPQSNLANDHVAMNGSEMKDKPANISGFLIQRAGRYFRTLPRRLIARYLYNKSPFWGDGIIIVARVVS